ncbi:MAG TPA: uracil-DNA glycosylase [Blastocatellia bacterium]|nr:uracil-DNA glycosylase [Blastocatellia bacterium]
MPKEIIEEIAGIARQLEEQLKFYREIGIADIGGPARPAELAAGAAFEGAARQQAQPPAAGTGETDSERTQIQLPGEESMPKKKEQVEQAGLFGDLFTDEATQAAPKKVELPLIKSQDASLEAIREDIGECVRCKLHEHRTNIVFGEGNPQAKLIFVGEGPGADEDATGRPFVGRAGQLLDKIIAAIGLKREDVYIANVVKCRPPGNRTPERDEVATCEQFLFRQIAFLQPEVIVALGSPAFQCLLRTKETITRARGEWREWNGIKVMPTFHPAYLLRSPEKKREAWDDMKKVRDYLNSLPSSAG